MNELTDKTYCVLTFHDMEIWVTPGRAESIKQIMREGSAHVVDIDDICIKTSTIACVLPAPEVHEYHLNKSGLWRCEHGKRHKKGEECNCSADPLGQYRNFSGV